MVAGTSNDERPTGDVEQFEIFAERVAAFRVELAFLAFAGVVFAGLWLGLREDPVTAAIQVLVVAVLLLLMPRSGAPIRRRLTAAAVRRRFDRATRHCKLEHIRVTGVHALWSGHRIDLHLTHGQTFAAIETYGESLAASMGVRDVQVERLEGDASRGSVVIPGDDPFIAAAAARWPAIDETSEWSLWHPVPLGVDEHAGRIGLSLIERNILIGGRPGSGKSVAMSLLLATAALDARCVIVAMDGKQVELAPWQDSCASFSVRVESAIGQLAQVQELMDKRFSELRKAKLRKVTPDYPLYVVAIDELALFTSGAQKKLCSEFSDRLRDIVARGRAAGVIVIAATQKPGTDTIPSALRDLFALRLAFGCTTPEASDTILGRGYASRGFDASEIATGEPGVGYLLAEESSPVRLRTFYLTDTDVAALAGRARELRRKDGHLHDG
ncbi:MAG: FtsK/SpoIIIE domain-containing protein [Terracidiphilus sp.]